MARTYATPAAVIVISILFPVLGIVAVSLRIYTRTKSKHRLWLDDWLTIIALALEFVLAGLLMWGATTKSLGDLLPKPKVPGPEGYLFTTSDQQIRLQQIQYYFDFVGVFAFGALKLSILFFYRKLFCSTRVSRTPFSIATMTLIALVIAWTLAFGIGAIFVCGAHPAYAWAPVAIVAEKCSAQLPLLEGYAISDFIMDIFIWTLPIPQILRLHMSVQRKIAVTAVFLVGILAIAASATRMAIYIKYVVNAFAHSDGETLITYLLFWTMIECGLGVIVVCMPAIRPLYGKAHVGSVFSGIRSVFSLRSLLRTQSRSDSDRVRLGSMDRSKSGSFPHMNFPGESEGYVKTSVVGAPDLERQDSLQSQGIRVKNEVSQY